MAVATMLCQWASIDRVTPAELDSKIPPCTCWLSIFLRGTRQFNWFSMKMSVLEFYFCTGEGTWNSGLEMRNKRENPSQSCRRLWTQKLQFVFTLRHPPNRRIESSFYSLPLLPSFTPTSLLSIFFLEVKAKWNKLEHSLTWSPPKDNIIPGRDSQMRWIPPVYQRSF